MKLSELSFWEALAAEANGRAPFREACGVLRNIGAGIRVDGYACTLHFHRGAVAAFAGRTMDSWDFVISGSTESWRRLLAGETGYAQAIHPLHGALRMEGNALRHMWSVKALWELWRTSAAMGRDREADAWN